MNWNTGRLRAAWAGTLALGLLVLAGCSSTSGGRGCGSGACGGGSCGVAGPGPNATPIYGVNPGAGGAPAGQAYASPPISREPAAAAQRPYGGQKTCPVMGEELGSHGPAIPVTVQGQTVYVCCKGCVAKVQRDPDTHLAKVMAERARP